MRFMMIIKSAGGVGLPPKPLMDAIENPQRRRPKLARWSAAGD